LAKSFVFNNAMAAATLGNTSSLIDRSYPSRTRARAYVVNRKKCCEVLHASQRGGCWDINPTTFKHLRTHLSRLSFRVNADRVSRTRRIGPASKSHHTGIAAMSRRPPHPQFGGKKKRRCEGKQPTRLFIFGAPPALEANVLTTEQLVALCDYLDSQIVPADDKGPHCDATLCCTRDYLAGINESAGLAEYLEAAGQAECDCVVLMNLIDHLNGCEAVACIGCGSTVQLTTAMVHGERTIQ
jgi:hypothetical protein